MSQASSLTQRAYVSIRAELLACRLPPGERLNIKELAGRLAVSLGAVREALSRLTSEGFVVADARRGFRAAPISMMDLKDLTQIRTIIEVLALRRSIEVGDVAWESQLVAAYHRLSRTPVHAPGDPINLSDEYAAAHGAYHEALVAACDSRWLLRMRRLLYAQSERYRYLAIPVSASHRHLDAEHETILRATLARDADKAAGLMVDHLKLTAEYLSTSSILASESSGSFADPKKPPPGRAEKARRTGRHAAAANNNRGKRAKS